MSQSRLALAQAKDLLPDVAGSMAVFGPATPDHVAGLIGLDLHLVQHSYLLSEAARTAGLSVSRTPPDTAQSALVCMPRAKSDARQLIAQAIATAPDGWIIVDGQKTDGIDSIAKAIGKTVTGLNAFSKAHGKTIWFRADQAAGLLEWTAAQTTLPSGWVTAPGVFSADGIDPASELLAQVVPPLSGRGADLGAGWGYLSAQVLSANASITHIDLLEDNAIALDCAGVNVTDARATRRWHNALTWSPPQKLDWVIMNPPFHTARKATPELGQDFVAAAARILRPGGMLYMVANAHLPYEDCLQQNFHAVSEITRTNRFKVFRAEARRSVKRTR